MRTFFVLWRRELASCFLSPVAYITMIVFLLLAALSFVGGTWINMDSREPLPKLLTFSIAYWLPILIAVTSMRLFAEENRSGTIETLLTAPVTEAAVVFGKYAGALVFLCLVLIPPLASVFILAAVSPGLTVSWQPAATVLDLGGLFGGVLILVLLTAQCLAIGLLASVLTRNQIVAAITCILATCAPLIVEFASSLFLPGGSAALRYLSVTAHLDAFSQGSIDTRIIALYLAGTLYPLFLATRLLEARRWT